MSHHHVESDGSILVTIFILPGHLDEMMSQIPIGTVQIKEIFDQIPRRGYSKADLAWIQPDQGANHPEIHKSPFFLGIFPSFSGDCKLTTFKTEQPKRGTSSQKVGKDGPGTAETKALKEDSPMNHPYGGPDGSILVTFPILEGHLDEVMGQVLIGALQIKETFEQSHRQRHSKIDMGQDSSYHGTNQQNIILATHAHNNFDLD